MQEVQKNEHSQQKYRQKQFQTGELTNEIQKESHIAREMLKSLLPPNPLISKQILGSQQCINMKLLQPHNQRNISNKRLYINHLKKTKQSVEEQYENKILNLFNGYNIANLLYLKYENGQINQRNKKKYFSSIFSQIYLKNNKFQMALNIPAHIGMTTKINNPQKSLINYLEQELQFSSNFQSGNLFAVYKTGTYEYDLILQNDFNTNGCTQWFYFVVQSKNNKNFVAKFNIINLYKAQSLYNKGMKPVVNSGKSGKGWLRKGFNIYYDQNSLKCEQSKKYYKTLSFCYDFTKQNDSVSFSHAIPYSYSKLQKLIKVFQSSNKCNVKIIGLTPLKKPLKIIKFQTQNKAIQKKAIIIMARQHPGQTQGSFIIQEILMNLLKPNQQIEFLLWRFNFYIIPMVNIDGVSLGNYRSNAMGFDLNRNWQSQSKSKHPQVFYIKNQIKKIMSKQKIELILDLHGHSRKMNSFFYGNPFGSNPYLYPYVASKITPFIKFQDCRFSYQKKQKANTARVVLGNMIKQTGNVYTYEVSFYGGTRNQKKTTFLQDHYKQLGKDLLKAMHKVYNQQYKQEKSLKQSLYLKQIRRQITGIQDQIQYMQEEGSDSEAQNQMEQFSKDITEQIKQRMEQITKQKSQITNAYQNNLSSDPFSTIDQMENSSLQQKKSKSQIDRLNKILQRNHQSFSQQSENIKKRLLKKQIIQMSSIIKTNQIINDSISDLPKKPNYPMLHAQKLKIYGQTYLIKSPLYQSQLQKSNSDIQTLDVNCLNNRNSGSFSFMEENKSRIGGSLSLNIKKNNIKRHNDLETSMEISNRQDDLMNNIVRINRLQYKKIKRQQKKAQQIKRSPSKKSGVFKLPSILKQFKK